VRTAALLLFVSLMMSEASCRSSGFRLDLILKNNTSIDDMIRNAPIIVIGKVLSEDWVGPLVDQQWRLFEVRVAVENLIRGNLNDSFLTFYFYSSWGAAVANSNTLHVRGRYVLFLMRDQGVLRAVEDQRRTSIQVPSGRHRSLPLTSDRPLTERIGVLLMTPGEEFRPSYFGAGLLLAAPFAQQHLGRWRTVKILKGLLASPYRAVRIGACEELTRRFFGQDDCWNTLDVDDGSDFRWHYGIIPPMVSRRVHQNHQMETQDADRWWQSWIAQRWYTKAELLDELRLLTTDNDRRIRRRFCGLLQEKFPDETDSGCGVDDR
jgi:hypothetical protein